MVEHAVRRRYISAAQQVAELAGDVRRELERVKDRSESLMLGAAAEAPAMRSVAACSGRVLTPAMPTRAVGAAALIGPVGRRRRGAQVGGVDRHLAGVATLLEVAPGQTGDLLDPQPAPYSSGNRT